MYRVMIVDDEAPVLDSFAHIFEKGIDGFELCGTAGSGTEAIELVPRLKPHLVFMDIQMPGLDGIETIKIIRQRDPGILFILASAYERFDVARKAIPLGVFNYLVKPIIKRDLAQEFAKVKAQLDESSEQSDLRLRESDCARRMRDEETRRFLLGLAWAGPSEREWEDFRRQFSVKGDRGAVALLRARGRMPRERVEGACDSIIRRIRYKSSCVSASLSGLVILLFHEDEPPDEISAILEKAAEGDDEVDWRIGTGAARHYSALSESYREAFEQLRGFEGERSSAARQRRAASDLCALFLRGEWDEVEASYRDFWTEVFVSNDFLVAKARMIEFFACLMRDLDGDRGIPGRDDLDTAMEIVELRTMQAWQQWSSYMMERLRYMIKERRDKYYPKPLSLALNCMQENFLKPLSLGAVAEKCEISQGYLSRLFSEHLDTSFVDYLNSLRINEAARLLKSERKPVKEVSYMVGYADPNYFSRVFKRNLKVSPSEYANGGSKNEE